MVTELRPGTLITSRATPPSSGAATLSGTLFAGGIAERGPVNDPQLLNSIDDFEAIFGVRLGYSATAYDGADVAFREGTADLWFARSAGPAATKASLTLKDQSGGAGLDTMKVEAKEVGDYAHAYLIQVVATEATSFRFVISTVADGTVEESPEFTTLAEAVTWSSTSEIVNVTDLASASANPTDHPRDLAATALAGGADDRASVDDTVKAATLDSIDGGLGPGLVAYFGATTDAMHISLTKHGEATNREALLDLPDTDTTATLISDMDSVRAEATASEEWAAGFAPWVLAPGATRGAPERTVAPSALVAGLMARGDAIRSVNDPAAGVTGQARYCTGVTQTFTAVERDALNTKSVNVIRLLPRGRGVRLYGYVTGALGDGDLAGWRNLGNQRLRILINDQFDEVAERYVLQPITPRNIGRFNGELAAILLGHYNAGALYGSTPDEAYRVDTSDNNATTAADRKLLATSVVKMSEYAEFVAIETVKINLTESV